MNSGLDMGEGKYIYKKTKMPEVFEDQALVKVKSSGICGSDLHNTIEEKIKHILQKLEIFPKLYLGDMKYLEL